MHGSGKSLSNSKAYSENQKTNTSKKRLSASENGYQNMCTILHINIFTILAGIQITRNSYFNI